MSTTTDDLSIGLHMIYDLKTQKEMKFHAAQQAIKKMHHSSKILSDKAPDKQFKQPGDLDQTMNGL